MKLFELKKEMLLAMKNKDVVKKNILSIVIGKIENEGKLKSDNVDESLVVLDAIQSIHKSLVKSKNELSLKSDAKSIEFLANLDLELAVLESYLPVQMSDDEIRQSIEEILSSNLFSDIKSSSQNVFENKATMGILMKELKSRHNGKYDSKNAMNIIKSFA